MKGKIIVLNNQEWSYSEQREWESCVIRAKIPPNLFYHTKPDTIIKDDVLAIIPVCKEGIEVLGLKDNLDNIRGSFYMYGNIPVMPTLSMSGIFKQWINKTIITMDLVKLSDYLYNGKQIESIKVDIINTVAESISILKSLRGKDMAFDIETLFGNPKLLCFGFSYIPYQAITSVLEHHSLEDRAEILFHLQGFLKGNNIIMHNAMFDWSIMGMYGLNDINMTLDTMLAFHLLYPELEKSLAFTQSIYTMVPYHKSMSKTDKYTYNGIDAGVTLLVANYEMEDLKNEGQLDNYKIFHNTIGVYKDMNCVNINTNMLDSLLEESNELLRVKQNDLTTSINKQSPTYNGTLNVSSPKQVCGLLYDNLGMEPKGKKSSDDLALKGLITKYPKYKSIINNIQEVRHYKKIISTYLNKDEIENGMFYTTYNPSGTKSMRVSADANLMYGGVSILTVPKEYRKMYIPPIGYKMFGADLSQAELRIVAYYSKEQVLIDYLESGNDVFKWIASMIFSISIPDVSDGQRQLAKKCVHAINYGMSDYVFGIYAGISMSEAKKINMDYFRRFPNISRMQKEVVAFATQKRFIIIPHYKWKRIFYNHLNDNEVISLIPQSVVRFVCSTALVEFSEWCKETKKAIPAIDVHDCIVGYSLPENVEESSIKLKSIMEKTLLFGLTECKMKSSIKVGDNWYEVS